MDGKRPVFERQDSTDSLTDILNSLDSEIIYSSQSSGRSSPSDSCKVTFAEKSEVMGVSHSNIEENHLKSRQTVSNFIENEIRVSQNNEKSTKDYKNYDACTSTAADYAKEKEEVSVPAKTNELKITSVNCSNTQDIVDENNKETITQEVDSATASHEYSKQSEENDNNFQEDCNDNDKLLSGENIVQANISEKNSEQSKENDYLQDHYSDSNTLLSGDNIVQANISEGNTEQTKENDNLQDHYNDGNVLLSGENSIQANICEGNVEQTKENDHYNDNDTLLSSENVIQANISKVNAEQTKENDKLLGGENITQANICEFTKQTKENTNLLDYNDDILTITDNVNAKISEGTSEQNYLITIDQEIAQGDYNDDKFGGENNNVFERNCLENANEHNIVKSRSHDDNNVVKVLTGDEAYADKNISNSNSEVDFLENKTDGKPSSKENKEILQGDNNVHTLLTDDSDVVKNIYEYNRFEDSGKLDKNALPLELNNDKSSTLSYGKVDHAIFEKNKITNMSNDAENCFVQKDHVGDGTGVCQVTAVDKKNNILSNDLSNCQDKSFVMEDDQHALEAVNRTLVTQISENNSIYEDSFDTELEFNNNSLRKNSSDFSDCDVKVLRRNSTKTASVKECDAISAFLDQSNQNAEARLLARRQARAEAREIRMRDLERQQKEQEENADRQFDMLAEPLTRAVRTKTNHYLSSRRSSEDSLEDGGSIRELRHEFKEVEEKFRKAMIANAQLDNDKSAQTYQLELLKDRLEELEEEHSQLKREHRDKSRAFDQLQRTSNKLKEDLAVACAELDERDRLIKEKGLVIVYEDLPEEGGGDGTANCVPKKALVSVENAHLLESAGEGSLDVRLARFGKEKSELQDQISHLKLELEEERSKRSKSSGSTLNGPNSSLDYDAGETQREVSKQLAEYKFRAQKAEQDVATLQTTVARLESQVIRYKSAAEMSEKSEEALKAEKRKLQREAREAVNRAEELETSNKHLVKRLDKLKNAKSTLLKEL